MTTQIREMNVYDNEEKVTIHPVTEVAAITDFDAKISSLPAGPAGTITSASVSALPPGVPPTVTLGGTPQARTFNFGIPAGQQGLPGGLDEMPTLSISLSNHKTVLHLVSGTFKPGDYVFLMRYSASGQSSQSHELTGGTLVESHKKSVKGFRHPSHIPSTWGWPQYTPLYWLPDFTQHNGYSKEMVIDVNYTGMWANKFKIGYGRGRGTERIKFMAARWNPNMAYTKYTKLGTPYQVISTPMFYGNCINTVVVRRQKYGVNYKVVAIVR